MKTMIIKKVDWRSMVKDYPVSTIMCRREEIPEPEIKIVEFESHDCKLNEKGFCPCTI